ncbi:MAG: thiamine pyrophosphate-dependent enzyme [Endomicrobiales bacterium]|jgi:2-oxoglutarate ferredoxin oxidoreductase subunit beta
MDAKKLNTTAKNTWCPGCGNFAILNAIKAVISAIVDEGTPLENIIMVDGIGCHGKIADYINISSFYGLHGRAVPVATAIKIARPDSKIIVFAGDGDSYGEGLEHLLFAAKRNIDITMIVHNNRVYGLTTGQSSPTSPQGFKGRSTPFGLHEHPFNPLELVLAAGASFVARGYSNNMEALKKIIKEGIVHPGFALVDVLQVCATFFNRYDAYNKFVYELKDHDPSNLDEAVKKAREWNYESETPISLGIFYKKEGETFDRTFPVAAQKTRPRIDIVKEILQRYL